MRLTLDIPIINASGILSYPDVFELWERKGAAMGGWVTKSYSLKRRYGNENRTVYELEGGLINSMGLPNPGVEYDPSNIEKAGERDPLEELANTKLKKPLIISVAGFAPHEYAEIIRAFEKRVPNAKAYELNLSCPNITPGEKSIAGSIGDSPELVRQAISEARKVTGKPLIAKISPMCDVKKIAKTAEDSGTDYIGCANTVKGRVLDRNGRPVLAGGSGGMSGRIIKAVNLDKTRDAYQAIDPAKTGIVAYGGIEGVHDIIDYCREGAEIFGIGTAFMYMDTDEAVEYTKRIVSNLGIWLKDNGATLEKLKGSAHA